MGTDEATEKEAKRPRAQVVHAAGSLVAALTFVALVPNVQAVHCSADVAPLIELKELIGQAVTTELFLQKCPSAR